MSLQSGFIEFKLDYSANKDLEIGEVVSSENISAGGQIWMVNCYPRGAKEKDQGEYLSMYLQLLSKSRNVKAIFDVFLMGREGVPSSWHARRYPPPDGFNEWGFAQFVRRSDLESIYLTNGWVTIMCVVIVLQDNPLDLDRLDVPPSDIGMHLGRLLDCTDSSDVSFVVGGETFNAHRAVLAARSPVFKAQLYGSMAEAKMSSIIVHDIEASTFKVMRQFIYTDALPEDDELEASSAGAVFDRLLAAADLYQLDRLKLMCASKLWDRVSVDTVAATLACAETYSCSKLKKKCIAFLADEKNFRNAVLNRWFCAVGAEVPINRYGDKGSREIEMLTSGVQA